MVSSFNGFGRAFYGKRDFAIDGSFITTQWLVAFFLPILPTYSVRVRQLSAAGPFYSEYEVTSQSPISWTQVIMVYAYVYGLLPLSFIYPIRLELSSWMSISILAIILGLPFFLRFFGQKAPISAEDYQEHLSSTRYPHQQENQLAKPIQQAANLLSIAVLGMVALLFLFVLGYTNFSFWGGLASEKILGDYFVIFFLVSLLAGFAGIYQGSKVLEISAVVKYISYVLIFFPIVNLVPIFFWLYKSHLFIKRVNNDSQINVLSPPTQLVSNIPYSDHDLKSVIARVYFAGLPDMPDCSVLNIKVSSDLPTTERDNPIVLTAKGSLGVVYMHDTRNYTAMVSVHEMQNAELSMMRLHRIGMKNLAGLIKANTDQLKLRPYQTAYQLTFDHHHDASLILLDFLWDNTLRHLYTDAPVVAIPSRGTCAFCDATSKEGVQDLRAFSQHVTEVGLHLLDPGLFIRNESGQWLRFEAV